MRPRPQDVDASDTSELRDKALNLRESVNSARARMSAHERSLERLRREIADLRALAARPAPAARTFPAPVPAPISIPRETAPAPFAADARYDSWRPVPYIAIFFVAVGLQLRASRTAAPVAAVPVAAAVPAAAAVVDADLDDGGSEEALLLAHDWRLPGDERSLAERLENGTNPPGAQPEWTAERTGERTYRVSFRPSGSDVGYDFDVDLAARRVDPTLETAELISPRLVSRR